MPPLARHRQAQRGYLGFYLGVLSEYTHGQHLVMQDGQCVVNLLTHHRVTAHTHQVVGQHAHAQRRLGGPEVAQYKAVQSKVCLEFLDPVLAVC